MKITKTQLKKLIKESMDRLKMQVLDLRFLPPKVKIHCDVCWKDEPERLITIYFSGERGLSGQGRMCAKCLQRAVAMIDEPLPDNL
jgi:hypothetical protein